MDLQEPTFHQSSSSWGSSVPEAELYRIVFEQSPAFMCVLKGSNHVFEAVNSNYMKLVGVGRDILGKAVGDALPEIKGQGFLELLDKVYQTGEPFVGAEIKVFLQVSENETPVERYLDFTYQPLHDPTGKIYGIFAHGIDTSTQVVARQEVEKSKRRVEAERENIRILFEETRKIVALMKGPQHIFEYVNPAHIKLLGKD
jgi:PAS domain-containing protein